MTTETATVRKSDETRVNPFVGPRSLERGEQIFGRDVEIREVRAKLLSHRIVLLYSQSGAGKTSLIEAGLRPELEERKFQVFDTIRVGYDRPDGVDPDVNRYRVSVIESLEESRPDDRRTDPSELAGLRLDDYFTRLDREQPDRDPCLVFDQFEELFTLDPVDWDEKEAFLRELGDALADRGRWALFAMREDFIAQLDPYLELIPTRFATRYRLDLLGPVAARETITRTAATKDVDFQDEAAELLIEDLRRVQVHRGGERVREPGPTVEPVQLQVVCNRLWSRLPPNATSIGPELAQAAGDVDKALAEFYDAQVKATAGRGRASERTIRRWVERSLITVDGFRTQVRIGPGRSGGAVLRALEDTHLIRSDRIRGTRWYELSHDRFVEPIRASNAEFERRRKRRVALIAGIPLALVAVLVVAALGSSDAGQFAVVESSPIVFDQAVAGTVTEPGDRSVYTFAAEEGDSVVATVVATGGLTPEIFMRDSDGVFVGSAAGLTASGEPWVLPGLDLVAGEHLIEVTGSSGTTGDYELVLQRVEATGLDPGGSAPGSVASQDRSTSMHTFTVPSEDPVLVSLTHGDDLFPMFAVFGPSGVPVVGPVVEGGGTVGLVLGAPETGPHVITVTGLASTAGAYEVELGEPMADWDLDELAAIDAGPGVAEHWIDVGGTIQTCVPWDRSELVGEQTLTFTPFGSEDSSLRAWSAEFAGREGVDGYLRSFKSGCPLQLGEEQSIQLGHLEQLTDEFLWYVRTVDDANGDRFLDSVGVIATSEGSIAQLLRPIVGAEGPGERIPLDPDQPYENPTARKLAVELAAALLGVLDDPDPALIPRPVPPQGGQYAVDVPTWFPDPLPGSAGDLGSGCNPGTDFLPDGVWFGFIDGFNSTGERMFFDLACLGPEGDHSNQSEIEREVPVHGSAVAWVPIDEFGEDFDVQWWSDWWREPVLYQDCSLYKSCAWGWLYVNDGVVTEVVLIILPEEPAAA